MMSKSGEIEQGNNHRGLAVRPTNRLVRQTGKSNLLVDGNAVFKTRALAAIPPASTHATNCMPVLPANTKSKPKSTFEVYDDSKSTEADPAPELELDNKENNVIHMLEKQCEKEAKTSAVVATKKKSTVLERNRALRDEAVDDCSSIRSIGASTTCTIRGDLSSFAIGNEDEPSAAVSCFRETNEDIEGSSEYGTAPDRLDHADAIFCSPEFDADAYKYMRAREIVVRAKPNYLAKQFALSPDMRCILIDWLNDVAIEYKMQQETLHLAVSLVDRTLSRFRVDKWKLQLVGATGMMIASKFEEIYPPELKEFVYLTDDSYTSKQFLQMEIAMLNELKFEVSAPTTAWFARRLAKFANAEKSTQCAMEYLVDLTLLDLNFLTFRPSYVAAACLCYANLLTDNAMWNSTLQEASGIEPRSLDNILNLLHRNFMNASSDSNKHRSMHSRYAEIDMCSVSQLPPPSELPF